MTARLSPEWKPWRKQTGSTARSTHREMFDRLRTLETLSAVQENKLDTILKKLDEITAKVDALESRPAKRWEGLVEKSIWAVCAAVIAFLLGRVGL